MKDNFNSNFYITAATVIPLLYITLFLQSQIIQNLSRSFLRVGQKFLINSSVRLRCLGGHLFSFSILYFSRLCLSYWY
jgi:hypothetical protein